MNRQILVVTGTLLLVGVGCRDDRPSPTEPALTAPEASVTPATAMSFWQLSTGTGSHTCGVTTDYRAYCWGFNGNGQLGDGTSGDGYGNYRTRPHAVVGGLLFKQVETGLYHTCAVTPGNRAYCWGAAGYIGDGTNIQRLTPTPVAGTHSFRQVSAGTYHTCAVTTTNLAYCWGYNTHGQLGDGTITQRLAPVAVAGGLFFKQVTVGLDHTCGVTTTDRAYCWGYNREGQVGDSSSGWKRLKPVRVRSTRQFRQIDAGERYTCSVTTDNRAFCWGSNIYGQLGDGTTQRRWPRAVSGGLYFRRVTATGMGAVTCGETPANRAYCWGFNWSGEVGDGTRNNQRHRPVAVVGGLYFKQLSAGSCGKTDTSVGYCWGPNNYGRIGDGTDVSRTTPTRIADPM